MDPAKYEYQSEFARRWLAQGRAEGRTEGRAEGLTKLLARQLTQRFGALPPDAVRAQLAAASIEELNAIGDRLLTAPSLREVMKPR